MKRNNFILDKNQFVSRTIPSKIQIIYYDPALYTPNLFSFYQIHKPLNLRKWVVRRQAQFLAGRIATQESLLNTQKKSVDILSGKHREPLWPENISGSISHCDELSIATTQLNSGKIKSIGLDIESIMDTKQCTNIRPIILDKSELHWFKKNNLELPENYLTTLIFSAKESYFKALFKQTGLYFNFTDVFVSSINMNEKKLILSSQPNSVISLSTSLMVYFEFKKFYLNQTYVITYCSDLSIN